MMIVLQFPFEYLQRDTTDVHFTGVENVHFSSFFDLLSNI